MSDLVASRSQARTFCTFRSQGRLYGIDVKAVREVSAHLVVTPVPQAPSIIRGLANLRSRIILVLDMRAALGQPSTACTLDSRLIVLQPHVVEQVGLLVDQGGEIIRALPDRIENSSRIATDPIDPPAYEHSDLVVEVCKLENELMMIIDPPRLVTAVERAVR